MRGGKILGGTAGFVGGMIFATGAGPVFGSVGFGVGIYSMVRAGINVLNKTEHGLMFVSKSKLFSNETRINQSSKIDSAIQMINYVPSERAAMMTPQTLIGLSRYKDSLKGSPYYEKEDGSKKK